MADQSTKMTGAQFEAQFLAQCKEMQVTSISPAQPAYNVPAYISLLDSSCHADVSFCGCGDVKVYRAKGKRDIYSVCTAHGLQPLGKARRMRKQWQFVGALA